MQREKESLLRLGKRCFLAPQVKLMRFSGNGAAQRIRGSWVTALSTALGELKNKIVLFL